MPIKSLGIIIVTGDRFTLLEKCLRSTLLALQNCSLQAKITIIFNGSSAAYTSQFAELEQHLNSTHPIRKIEARGSLTPAEARNLAFKNNESDWIFFLDDDAYPPKDHFAKFKALVSAYPEPDIFGGPNLTPPGSDLFQRATGAVLSSRLATWNSNSRYRQIGVVRPATEKNLILCNLFVRGTIANFLLFDPSLTCAEENWFLIQADRLGFKSLYSPDLFVHHERRPEALGLARQCHKYGFGRAQVTKENFRASNLTHFAPSLLLVLNISWPLGVLYPSWLFLLSVIDLLYIGLLIVAAALISIPKERAISFLVSFCIFPLIHFSYGLGFLRGLITHRKLAC